ncbi:MAG: cation:proton antiporter [Candidatus Omnitrophica bacterium]|nr:cation:proton antiporter [Candidatus Omnitrophota bacterium]
MDWLIQIAAIIIFARIAGILSRKIGVSSLFGEILFGIVLGSVAVWQHWQFDIHLLRAFAEIGIVFLIFIIGLETNVYQIISVGFRGTLVAALGVILPFIAGYLTARAYGYDLKVALFVASTFTATSVAISARVFMDQNLVHHRSSQTVLVAAVVDDILGFLVFTAVLILEQTGNNGSSGWLTRVLPAGFFLFVFIPLMWLAMNPIHRWLNKLEIDSKFVLIIGILFIAAFVAHTAGLAPIIGAFFLGMALSMKRDTKLAELTHPLSHLFAPIFFVYMGFQVNLMAVWQNWPMACVLILVAVLAKLIGAGLGVVFCRGSWREALVVGIGMVPRGEVGLIIASIGKSMNIIDDALFGSVTLMCIATTLIAPLPLKKAIEAMVAKEKI